MVVAAEASSAGVLDVEAIMAEIRADIESRKLDGTLISFEEIPNTGGRMIAQPVERYNQALMEEHLENACKSYHVLCNYEITGNPVVVFAKKLIRSVVRFNSFALVTNQNINNADVVNTLSQLVACVEEQGQLLEQQQQAIDKLVAQLNELTAAQGDVSEHSEGTVR